MPKKQPAPEPEPLTWLSGPWHKTSWLHPVYVSAGTYVTGQILHGLEVSPWWTAGTIAVGAGAGLLATAGERFHDWTRAFLASAGAFAGAWLTWATATSPYNDPSVISAVIGAAIYTAGYPAMRHLQHDREAEYITQRVNPYPTDTPQPTPQQPRDDKPEEARKWEALFGKVGLRGLEFVERVENRAGFMLRMLLPIDGSVTFNQVAAAAEKLEMAIRGRAGMVRVERGRDQNGNELAAEVWVHFDVRNILTETVWMPDDHSPLSINDAFPVGLFTDGTPITLRLREVAALIIGLRGRGKTNLMNVIIHQLSRCEDVVLWMIDLKGGRAAKPWLEMWLKGKARRPVLDWVATTRLEAHLMLLGALGLIRDRGRRSQGGSKITPSRKTPAVLVICDEKAALVGEHAGPKSKFDGRGATSRELAGILTEVIQLGRSEAVDYIGASQRSTVSMLGGGDLKSQCELRIALGVSSLQDAQSIFQGDLQAAKEVVKFKGENTRGAMLVQHGTSRVLAGKAFFLGDDNEMLRRIHEAAILHQEYPSFLQGADAAAVEAAVRAWRNPLNPEDKGGRFGYEDRWSAQRCAHLFSDSLPPEVSDADLDAAEAAAQAAAPTVPGASRRGLRVARFFQRRHRTVPQQRSESAPAQTAVSDDDWQQIVDAYEQGPEQEDHDRKTKMIEIIDQAGKEGIAAGKLYAEMMRQKCAPESRQTVHTWLNNAKDDGAIVQPSGPRGLYYTPRNAP